jgi:membrane associated rhomboid family serine protease
MFPYRDNLAAGGRAWGTWILVSILVVVNLPMFAIRSWYSEAIVNGGFYPVLFSLKPFVSSYRLVTAGLLHGDIFHLAGNCLFLVVFGRTLERLFGTRLLLLLFPLLGVTGFLLEWALHAESQVPVIGSSGAIAALMGAYLPLFPTARIRVIAVFGWLWKRFTMPAWVFLPYWIGLQVISIIFGSQNGVAYGVHAGSFAMGMIAAIVWKTSYFGADNKLSIFIHEAFDK